MKKTLKKSTLVNKIINKIEKKQIKMRSKIYFVLKSLLIILGILIIALFALYLISFITFALRVSGLWYLSGFGSRGIGIMFRSLPWLLILLGLILIFLLEILVKKFGFAYRRPILYSILAVIIIVLLGGLVINKTSLHPSLFRQAQKGNLPVAGRFYRDMGAPKFRNLHRGIITEIIDNGFIIETPREETLNIITTPKTRLPSGKALEENDEVVILGERDNGNIHAFDVLKIDDQLNIFPRRPMPGPKRFFPPR